MSRRIDPAVLAGVLEPQEVRISPDGKQVVYVTRQSQIRETDQIQSAVWIATLGKENSARQLTQNNFHHWNPTFSPDGRYIAFLSDRAKPSKCGALYLLPVDGGEAFPLTSKDNEMSISTYRWRPDGKAIAFISADEKSEERKQREKDGSNVRVYGEDVDYGRLRIIDVGTKEVKDIRSVERQGVSIAWDTQGTKLAYVTAETPELNEVYFRNQVHLVDPENDSLEHLCELKTFIEDIVWHEDRIWFRGNHEMSSCSTSKSVYAIDLDGPSQEPKVVGYGTTNCAAMLTVRNGEVIVQVQQGLTDIIETFGGKRLYAVKNLVSSVDVHFEPSRTSLVVAQGKTATPVEVYSIIDGSMTQLSQHGKEIADLKLGRAHLCEYTHEDGTPMDGFYAVPAELESAFVEKKPLPTVLWVRGGPYGRVTDCFNYFWHWSMFFMSLGYLVLCPNYRGGSSHGHDYAHATYHDASTSYQDVIWLVKKGIEEGHIDPERVSLTGWSQGGFMAYLSVTRDDTFHFRAVVAGAGVSHWATMCMTSDIPRWESDMSAPAPWALKLDDLSGRKSSPIYYIDKVKTPLLVVHGEADARVPIEQAVGFYRGMKEKGKDVTMATYPGESHGFPEPWRQKNYVDMCERVEKFLDKHMKS